jgi:hypothetical protein
MARRAVKSSDACWASSVGRANAVGIGRAGLISLALSTALMLAVVSVALAAPKGIFARFAQCPAGKPGMGLCLHAEVTGGTFAIGKTSIPIVRPIVVQDGALPTGGANFNEYFLSPPASGESIPSNELEIPGGLRGILQCPQAGCRGPSGNIAPNAVFATIETATSPANPGTLNMAAAAEARGVALTLPVRLQLRNSLLGSACYLGSTAHPIELRLTAGTTSPPPPNKPIAGTLGHAVGKVEDGYELSSYAGAELVDNTFSVPVAQGCGGQLASLVDSEIDQALGLESRAGHNTAILTSTLQLAEVEAVLASAAFPG